MDNNVYPKDDVQVYIILGNDNQVLESFSIWLKKKENFLVILDKDTNLKSKYDNHSNTIFKNISNILDITSTLTEIAWNFIFLNIELIVSPDFDRQEKTIASYVVSQWLEIKTGVHLSASAFVDYNLPDLSSAVQNIESNVDFSPLFNLSGYFKNIPAIICGAGPSLDQSFLDMKNKALVLSGGSALNALKTSPHFIGLIDSDTPPDFFQKSFEESILFFMLKAPNSILKRKFKQKFLCFPEENYLFFQWLIENAKIEFDLLDIGWSTVTFLTCLAIYFGCNPIIFNGVDLGFNNSQIYADNVSSSSYKKKKNQDYITVKNTNNNDLKTQNDWFMSGLFLQKLTSSNPDTTFYNASNKGLFLGENVHPFKFEEMKSWESIDLQKKINNLAAKHSTTLKKQLNYQILEIVDKELDVVNIKLLELEKMFNGQINEINVKEKSWCEEHVLNVLWGVFKHVFLRNEKNDENYHFKEKIHQVLFYKDVLSEHKSYLEKILK